MSKGKSEVNYQKKIYKAGGAPLTEIEELVARVLQELEVDNSDLSAELRDLSICSVKEVEGGAKKAVVIFVPYHLHKRFLKLQSRLIREFEKKIAGKHVVFIAQRTILSTAFKRQKPGQIRPRSRTLTSVHNAILEDLVYPTQIVGKRVRVRTDNSKLLKVYLDPKDARDVETKLKTFSSVYKKLTNKTVEFLFPPQDE